MGDLDAMPAVKWMKAPAPAFRFLDFDEAKRLIRGMADEPLWQTMVLVAMRTGLRLGELRGLRWCDVDLAAARLIVRQAVARKVVGTPKGGRQREVPLAPSVVDALKGWRHLRGPLVFCNDDGSMLTKEQCKWPLKRAQRRAGLTALGWHDLRHTFASHMVMRGVSLKAVQELLGHSTIEMTMRYAHLAPRVLSQAVDCLDEEPRGTMTAQRNPENGKRAARMP